MDKILMIIGVLVLCVNIITEVAKNVSEKLKTSKIINAFVLVVSEVMTLTAYVFYAHYNAIPIDGYGIVAGIVVGVFVAFSAMFGFDKLLVYVEPFLKGKE